MSLADLDPIVHAPKRMAALAILAASEWAEFDFLRQRLDVSESDLSKQMRVLQEAGYARVSKLGKGPGASTWYRLTRPGRRAFERHLALLRAMVADAPVAPGHPDLGSDPAD